MLWKNGRYAVAFATTAALKTGKEPDSASTEPAKPQDVLNSLTESAVRRYMIQKGIPGLTIGLTYNGKLIYSAGFGYSDVETGGKCNGQTVMRIASISKPITATVTALLLRDGKVELDKSIHSYISEKVFPKKSYDGRSVDITLRQLLSHTGGVRHYEKPSLNQFMYK